MSTSDSRASVISVKTATANAVKICIPASFGTFIQIAFLPRTGLNRNWISTEQSTNFYYRAKARVMSRIHPSLGRKVPPASSFSLVRGLFGVCRDMGFVNYYRQIWPAGRLLIVANAARYGSQIGIKETDLWSSFDPLQRLLCRIVVASSIEYILNSPFALPYTAAAAKLTPAFLTAQSVNRRPPVAVSVGPWGVAPGGFPRMLLKGCQISIQFEIAGVTRKVLPSSLQKDWPVISAFISGVVGRSFVELATVPLRNIGNFRNIGLSIQQSVVRTLAFPLLSSGINILAKGLSFGTALALIEVIESTVHCKE